MIPLAHIGRLLLEALPWCGQDVGGGDPATLFPACSLDGGGLKEGIRDHRCYPQVTHDDLPQTSQARSDHLTCCFSYGSLERAKGFEPSTPTLARLSHRVLSVTDVMTVGGFLPMSRLPCFCRFMVLPHIISASSGEKIPLL